MTLLLFTLIAANLCVYFAFASLSGEVLQMLPAVLAILALGPTACVCGSLAARKNPLLRFVFLLLPPLALLLTRNAVQALLLAPAVLYSVGVLIAGRFKVTYQTQREHFLWSGALLLLVLFIAEIIEPMLTPVLFTIADLILGAFTLRQLRFGSLIGWKQKGLELISVCVLPAGAGVLVLFLYKLLEKGGWLINRLIYPLVWLYEQFYEAFHRVYLFLEDNIETETETTMATAETSAFVTAEERPPRVSNLPDIELKQTLIVLGIFLAAALAIYLTVLIIRRLHDTRTDESLGERIDLETEIDEGTAQIPSEAERRTNRRKIRRAYEKYLKLLQRRRFTRQPQDSSQDILEKTRKLSGEEPAKALRELYILARYHPDALITDAQVREANRLLRQLRGS